MRTKILLPHFLFSALKLFFAQYLQYDFLRLLLIQSKLAANLFNHHLILHQIKITIDQLLTKILLELFSALTQLICQTRRQDTRWQSRKTNAEYGDKCT